MNRDSLNRLDDRVVPRVNASLWWLQPVMLLAFLVFAIASAAHGSFGAALFYFVLSLAAAVSMRRSWHGRKR